MPTTVTSADKSVTPAAASVTPLDPKAENLTKTHTLCETTTASPPSVQPEQLQVAMDISETDVSLSVQKDVKKAGVNNSLGSLADLIIAESLATRLSPVDPAISSTMSRIESLVTDNVKPISVTESEVADLECKVHLQK